MLKDIQAHLNNETVKELEPPPGLRVGPSVSVREVIAAMQQHRTGCVLVCEGRKLLGIFTEQDYLRRVLGQRRNLECPISEIMTGKPVTIRATERVATLVRRIH